MIDFPAILKLRNVKYSKAKRMYTVKFEFSHAIMERFLGEGIACALVKMEPRDGDLHFVATQFELDNAPKENV